MTIDKAEDEPSSLNDSGFQVIGKIKSTKIKPLKAPLPQWIKNKIIFPKDMEVIKDSSYDIDTLSSYLDDFLMQKLRAKGFTKFFPVQRKLIPEILFNLKTKDLFRPQDICVSSPTGSGKSLAFVLPIIQTLLKRIQTEIRALVILPSRDLALQVFNIFQEFTQGSNLNVLLSVGHCSLQDDISSIVKQEEYGFRTLIDILITTPSRLINLIEDCPGFNLRNLEILVLDETDRIMDFEHEYNWFQEIENAVFGRSNSYACFCDSNLNKNAQRNSIFELCGCSLKDYSKRSQSYIKLLFSATLSQDIDNLYSLNLFQPKFFLASDTDQDSKVIVSKDLIPESLSQKFLLTKLQNKPLIMWYLIEKLGYRKVLCFTRTLQHSRVLYRLLKNIPGLDIFEFSSTLKDNQREELLKRFNEGNFDVIIATDIMTRGIDINSIQYVISYDVPFDEVQYIHRIGRTARAGQDGTAITLLLPNEMKNFWIMLRKIHSKQHLRQMIEKMTIRDKQLKKIKLKYKSAIKRLRKITQKDKARLVKLKRSTLWKGISN